MEHRLVEVLSRYGYSGASAPIFIQSFEVANLQELAGFTDLPLIQLVAATGRPYDFTAAGDGRTFADLIADAGLREIATYASGVGVQKELVLSLDAEASTPLVPTAHGHGLLVHAWTFRAENYFLPTPLRSSEDPRERGDLSGEIAMHLDAGLDGFFTDHSDLAVEAIEKWAAASLAG
jgi:glycerophosphoryl diester phosphodiesterase